METVLILSEDKKERGQISGLLSFLHGEVTFANCGSEARRIAGARTFDYIFVCCPLPDESAQKLAIALAQESGASIILVVDGKDAEEVAKQVQAEGIFVVPRPIDTLFFQQAVRIIALTRSKLAGLSSENSKLQTKIEEIRMVNRAKCVLIQYLNMTEQQAHRYIEKQAMNMRSSKMDVAQGILKTYEY